MELSLAEAAKHIGVPAPVLHSWTWTKCGPEPVNKRAIWRPTYTRASLDKWLREMGVRR